MIDWPADGPVPAPNFTPASTVCDPPSTVMFASWAIDDSSVIVSEPTGVML